MKISVKKYTLEPDTVDGGTAGSHGMESLEFDFSPEWDDLSRTVTFFPPKSVAKCVSFSGSAVAIPPEVTKRAGKTSFVLCGARDGAAVITLTGVIKVSESLVPDEEQTTEHTPGAIELATLLCQEARVDAQRTAVHAAGAKQSENKAERAQAQVAEMHSVITDIYDEVQSGTAVHASITEANRLDGSHAVSVAGGLAYLDAILGVISPLRVKVVENLPTSPSADTIYLQNGEPMIYAADNAVDVYRWTPTYTEGGGPAELYTAESSLMEGATLYWSTVEIPTQFEHLAVFDTITEVNGDSFVCQYGTFTAVFKDTVLIEGEGGVSVWRRITSSDSLTPYLKDNPAKWLIEGGAL